MITLSTNQPEMMVYSISSSQGIQSCSSNIKVNSKSRERSRYLNRKSYSKNKELLSKCISISSQSESENESQDKCKSTSIRHEHFYFKRYRIVNQKYRLLRILGEGSFGKVIQAQYNNTLFAIKFLKPHHKSMHYGQIQSSILKNINYHDQNDQKGIVKLIETFCFEDYYCLVFQSLGQNLFKIIEENKYIGFDIKTVQSFFKQILTSIGFLHSLGYTHTDIKPENVVLRSNYEKESFYQKHIEQKTNIIEPKCNKIKLIDFGNTVHESQHHISIINTRQYRAPQVILGCCKWDSSSDLWSIGCMIIQLLTGKLTFSVKQDIQHLFLIKHLCGQYPKWMLNRSQRYQGVFKNPSYFPNSIINQLKIQRVQMINQQMSKYKQFKSLIMKCLQIDPRKRITCQQALKHEFFSVNY